MKVRIKFSKQGNMKFIGHLDLMRYFQKAIRRAKIPVCYSGGYSPHQIMSFASPLGVGLTSTGEYLDIEVSESEASFVMAERLNRVMAEGIEILSWKRLEDSSKNAMSIVEAADYRIAFRRGYEPEDMDRFQASFIEFVNRDQILILKKSKKSEREVDIRPFIYEAYWEENVLFMKLASGSANNLKPELVMESFCLMAGIELSSFALLVQREELYSRAEDGSFVPLDGLGEEIE